MVSYALIIFAFVLYGGRRRESSNSKVFAEAVK